MNINPIIEETLKDFEVDGEKIPVHFLRFTGQAQTYLTYYTWREVPDNFADDEHKNEISYLTVDVFSKKNFKGIVKKLKKIMKQNGFTWEDTAPEQYESDTGYFHVPVNFYYIGKVDE